MLYLLLQEEVNKVVGAISNSDIKTINEFIQHYGIDFRDPRPYFVSCV